MEVTSQRRKQLRIFVLASAASINIMLFNQSSSFGQSKTVYVLLYNSRTNNEGIYTTQTATINNVLMFDSKADASSFATRLKTRNFPRPTVKAINIEEILGFCRVEHHICQLIPAGLNIAPPTDNTPPAQRGYKLLPNRSLN